MIISICTYIKWNASCVSSDPVVLPKRRHIHTHTKNDNMQQVFDRFIYLIDIFDKFLVTPVVR